MQQNDRTLADGSKRLEDVVEQDDRDRLDVHQVGSGQDLQAPQAKASVFGRMAAEAQGKAAFLSIKPQTRGGVSGLLLQRLRRPVHQKPR